MATGSGIIGLDKKSCVAHMPPIWLKRSRSLDNQAEAEHILPESEPTLRSVFRINVLSLNEAGYAEARRRLLLSPERRIPPMLRPLYYRCPNNELEGCDLDYRFGLSVRQITT